MRFYLFPIGLIAAGTSLAHAAVPKPAPSGASLYVRVRAAEAAGDAATASAGLAALLAQDPGNSALQQRAYRQAVVSGDMALALRIAKMLDGAAQLPPDGRVLLALNAIKERNWPAADVLAERIAQERLFAFFAPFIHAWAAQGAGKGDPLAIMEPARSTPLTRAYFPEQRVLLMLAQGKAVEALAWLGTAEGGGVDRLGGPTRLRFADALNSAGARQQALSLVAGSDPAYATARTKLAEGTRLTPPTDEPATALSVLISQVAGDFARQRMGPLSLALARFAAFVAPDNAAAWLVSAELLAAAKRPDAALAALDRIAPADPVASLASGLRIGVLAGDGDTARALTEARAVVERDPTPLALARLGDVEMMGDRPREAAAAYTKAVAAADQAKAPPTMLWPMLLQLAAALDQAGDWPGAKAAMARAYKLAPNEASVLNQYGYSQIEKRENVAEASRMIEQASALRPDDAAITDSLGWANFLRGRTAEAVPLLEKAAADDPSQSDISEHLGDAYWTIGRHYEARFAWRAALITAEDEDKSRLTAKIDGGLSVATAAP
jgi:tetratricopeptide (TPR) repeat protein